MHDVNGDVVKSEGVQHIGVRGVQKTLPLAVGKMRRHTNT